MLFSLGSSSWDYFSYWRSETLILLNTSKILKLVEEWNREILNPEYSDLSQAFLIKQSFWLFHTQGVRYWSNSNDLVILKHLSRITEQAQSHTFTTICNSSRCANLCALLKVAALATPQLPTPCLLYWDFILCSASNLHKNDNQTDRFGSFDAEVPKEEYNWVSSWGIIVRKHSPSHKWWTYSLTTESHIMQFSQNRPAQFRHSTMPWWYARVHVYVAVVHSNLIKNMLDVCTSIWSTLIQSLDDKTHMTLKHILDQRPSFKNTIKLSDKSKKPVHSADTERDFSHRLHMGGYRSHNLGCSKFTATQAVVYSYISHMIVNLSKVCMQAGLDSMQFPHTTHDSCCTYNT